MFICYTMMYPSFLAHNLMNYCFCLSQVEKEDENTNTKKKKNTQNPLRATTPSPKHGSLRRYNQSELISMSIDCAQYCLH